MIDINGILELKKEYERKVINEFNYNRNISKYEAYLEIVEDLERLLK